MDLQYLCTNCLTGTVRNGTCTYCHKSVNEASKQPANALPVRYMLGSQYYLGKVIGNGGFGITYLAWDCIEQRRVIVKELYPRQDVQRDPASKMVVPLKGQEDYFRKLKHRFKEEAQILYSFRHEPSVMNVYRLMEDNNTVYYSMEYLSGFDLKTYMEQQGKLGWPQLSGYIRKILYTLHILHGQNLIHRDISPDNVMVQTTDAQMKAKLLDFGAARDIGRRRSGKSESIVKDGYSAPEQYMEDGEIGTWTDVYAMAAVIYSCLTGKRIPAAPERMMKPAPLDMEGIRNKKVRGILEQALCIRAEERIRTMKQFRAALAGAVPGRNRLAKGLLAAAAAFAICAAGVGVYAVKPWLPSVERLGTGNANLLCNAGFAQKIGEHMYYIDGDWNLHVSPYDRVDDRLIVDSEAAYINLSSDKVYFLHDNAENPEEPDSIMEMDFDGTNVRTVCSAGYYNDLQYVRYSDGKEMLYYLKGENEGDGLSYTLCRYDLKTGKEEELLKEKAVWYNLDGKYIYYTVLYPEGQGNAIALKRAYLDGKNSKVLNDKDFMVVGFIEEGKIYMVSFTKEQLVVCDLDGRLVESPMKEYAEQMNGDSLSYGNGWIYYSPEDSGEIHRIRTDGTGDSVIYSGDRVVNMSYADVNWLWFMTQKTGGLLQTYLLYCDGSNLIQLEDQ